MSTPMNLKKLIHVAQTILCKTYTVRLPAFKQHLIEPGRVKPQTQQLLDNALDWRMGAIESIDGLLPQVEDLVSRVEELFLSLDANLKFKAETLVQKAKVKTSDTKNHIIELRSVACPLNFVKAKLELEKIEIRDILNVLLDRGEAVRNGPASFAEQGKEVMEVKSMGDHYRNIFRSCCSNSGQSGKTSGQCRQADCGRITRYRRTLYQHSVVRIKSIDNNVS
jgi:TusA-related sulfurtransferase